MAFSALSTSAVVLNTWATGPSVEWLREALHLTACFIVRACINARLSTVAGSSNDTSAETVGPGPPLRMRLGDLRESRIGAVAQREIMSLDVVHPRAVAASIAAPRPITSTNGPTPVEPDTNFLPLIHWTGLIASAASALI